MLARSKIITALFLLLFVGGMGVTYFLSARKTWGIALALFFALAWSAVGYWLIRRTIKNHPDTKPKDPEDSTRATEPSAAVGSNRRDNLLWWVISGVLAGMPMPFIHPERRMAGGGALTAFDDELPMLHALGIRAVVSLLDIPRDVRVYESAGFAFRCLPIQDGGAPTMEQTGEFVRFVNEQRAAQRPVAVHCEAGIGRTGTMLAAYLISQGDSAPAAIQRVRAVERVAVETARQIQFLEQYAARVQG